MKSYKEIVVAVDLSEDANYVLQRAKEIADTTEANLTLIHVVQPIVMTCGSAPLNVQALQDDITQQSIEHVRLLAQKIDVNQRNQHIVYGSPEKEIHRIALEIEADLIIAGSHEHHGLGVIFGSTSTSILHHAPCDFLAIRVR